MQKRRRRTQRRRRRRSEKRARSLLSWHHERVSVHYTVARSLRLKSGVSKDHRRSSRGLAPLNDLAHGGHAWEKHKTQVLPHTTETAQQQNNATPASDVSTKQETQCRAARTPSRGGFEACKYQILRQRRPLFQPQHRGRCPTLGDLLTRGRNSSLENTLCAMWPRSLCLQSSLRSRPQKALRSSATSIVLSV